MSMEITDLQRLAKEQLSPEEIARLTGDVQTWTSRGVHSDQDAASVNDLIVAITAKQRWWDGHCKPVIETYYRPYKMLRDLYNPIAEKLASLRAMAEAPLKRYITEQRLAKERREADLARQAEEQRQKAEADARQAMIRGDVAESKVLAQTAQNIVAPILPDPTPKLSSTQVKDNWKVRVTDPLAFLAAVSRGEVPLEYVEIKVAALQRLAAKRDGLNIPGIEATQEVGFAVRKRV